MLLYSNKCYLMTNDMKNDQGTCISVAISLVLYQK